LVALIAVPVFLTAVRAVTEQRSTRAIVGLIVLAAVLAGLACGAAELVFAVSRHCFS
jgi:hypothetical protein